MAAQRELQDFFFKEAKRNGFRSRAAYKLTEIDDKRNLLSKKDVVLDLGAAPGSWLPRPWRSASPLATPDRSFSTNPPTGARRTRGDRFIPTRFPPLVLQSTP